MLPVQTATSTESDPADEPAGNPDVRHQQHDPGTGGALMPAVTVPISVLHNVIMRSIDQGLQKKMKMEVSRDGNFQIAQAEITIIIDAILTMPDGERKVCTLNMSGSLCMNGDIKHVDGHEYRIGEMEFTLNR